jgi:hypothetical protein
VSVRNNRYQKETIFRIVEMVLVDSTDTYNFLPTDMKYCFCSSECVSPRGALDIAREERVVELMSKEEP